MKSMYSIDIIENDIAPPRASACVRPYRIYKIYSAWPARHPKFVPDRRPSFEGARERQSREGRLIAMVRLSLYERPNGCISRPGNTVTYSIEENKAHFGACSVSGPALQWILEPTTPSESASEPTCSPSCRKEIELPDGPVIMRCDRIDFPPGGVAYTHTHPGPGIRRLISGSIDIRTNDHVNSYIVGGAWFESGPDPVHATGSAYEPSAFVRVLVLPAKWAGMRTIKYVDPADAEKPKLQTPTVFLDAPAIAPTQMRTGGGIQLLWGIASLDNQDDTKTTDLVRGLQRLRASGLLEVDVARIYGEAMLNRCVTELAQTDPQAAAEVVINTKASVRTNREDTRLSFDGVRNQLHLSLAALGRERVNIFYLHQPDRRFLLDDALRACDELHKEGRFAELGLSNFPAW